MRLAVLTDIHGNLPALEAVLNDLQTQGGADQHWILGDLAAHGAFPAECVSRLQALPNAAFVQGNTDRYLVTGQRGKTPLATAETYAQHPENLRRREAVYSWALERLSFDQYEFLRGMRHEIDLQVPSYGWVIGYHGVPGDDEGMMFPETPDDEVLDFFADREGRLGFGGHTHRRMDRDLTPWRVINPGSVGLSRDLRFAYYALVDFDGGEAQVDYREVSFDWQGYVEAARRVNYPDCAFLQEWFEKLPES